jgi:hypothetical protein
VSDILPAPLQLNGLLHDATEAYLGDVIFPLKQLLQEYRTIEKVWEECIFHAFGISPEYHECVKYADNVALLTERRDLLGKPSGQWYADTLNIKTYPGKILPLCPATAEKMFLERYEKLRARPNPIQFTAKHP